MLEGVKDLFKAHFKLLQEVVYLEKHFNMQSKITFRKFLDLIDNFGCIVDDYII